MSLSIRVTEQLQYLIDTDEGYAQAKAKMKGLEHRLKVRKAQLYLEATGPQGVREQEALAHVDYERLVQTYEDSVLDMEIMAARRKTAELHVEVWRSLNANQRKGNI